MQGLKTFILSPNQTKLFRVRHNVVFSRHDPVAKPRSIATNNLYNSLFICSKFSCSSARRRKLDRSFVRNLSQSQSKEASLHVYSTGEIDKELAKDMKNMQDNIDELLDASHPLLKKIAHYYIGLQGKRIRPQALFLLSRAFQSHNTNGSNETVLPKQLQLAMIVEMIHNASITHDDVIDEATTRRGVPSINILFQNKPSILAGDYLLAKASVRLSELENFEVTRLISLIISDLVEGEFMQLKPLPSDNIKKAFEYYLRKTYLKTASLFANGCKATAILGNTSVEDANNAYEYGNNLGMAFQLVDDLLDFTGSNEKMGKKIAVDLSLGLATAPVLFAKEEFPELAQLIDRQFNQTGDVEEARNLVNKSKGIEKTHLLAQSYSAKAIQSLRNMRSSKSKDSLIQLAHTVVVREV